MTIILNDCDFDNLYMPGFRRWETVFPDEIKFIEIYKPFLITKISDDEINDTLYYLWYRFNAEHRSEVFRWKNIGKIINEFFVYVSEGFELKKAIEKMNALVDVDFLASSYSKTKNYDTDNDSDTAAEFLSTASETASVDVEKISDILKSKQKLNLSLNELFVKSKDAFLLLTDNIIETTGGFYE